MASNNNGERFDGGGGGAASNTVTSRRGKNKSNNNNNNNNSNNNNNNNSEKPKQPQRGLGVAQLEKIRLHSQLINRGFLHPNHHHHHHPGFIHPPFQHVPEYQFGYQIPPLPPPPPLPQQQSAPPFGYSAPQLASSSYAYHHHLNASMMEMRHQMERYGESQPINTARWNPSNNFHGATETQPNTFPPGMITRHLLSQVEQENDCSSQNFDSNGKEEVDLELKL